MTNKTVYLFFMCMKDVCVCVYTHLCAYGGQRATSGMFLYHTPPNLLRQGLLLNLEFTDWLVCLTNEPQGYVILLSLLPSAEITVSHHQASFTRCWRAKQKSSYLPSKHFTHEAIAPTHLSLFLIGKNCTYYVQHKHMNMYVIA